MFICCFLSRATVLEFLQQPADMYYLLDIPNSAAIIPCQIVETLPPDDTQRNIDSTFWINSVQFNPYEPIPPRFNVQLVGGIIVSLVITPVLAEDSGTVIQCGVKRSGGETLLSRISTLLVGGKGWGGKGSNVGSRGQEGCLATLPCILVGGEGWGGEGSNG